MARKSRRRSRSSRSSRRRRRHRGGKEPVVAEPLPDMPRADVLANEELFPGEFGMKRDDAEVMVKEKNDREGLMYGIMIDNDEDNDDLKYGVYSDRRRDLSLETVGNNDAENDAAEDTSDQPKRMNATIGPQGEKHSTGGRRRRRRSRSRRGGKRRTKRRRKSRGGKRRRRRTRRRRR